MGAFKEFYLNESVIKVVFNKNKNHPDYYDVDKLNGDNIGSIQKVGNSWDIDLQPIKLSSKGMLISTETSLEKAQKKVINHLKKPLKESLDESKERLYWMVLTQKGKSDIVYKNLKPMTHKECMTFKSKQSKPSDWTIKEVEKDLKESFGGPSKPKKVTVDHWDGLKPVIAYHYDKSPNIKGNGIDYVKVLRIYWRVTKKGPRNIDFPHLDGALDTKELWAEVVHLDNKFKPYGERENQSVDDIKNDLLSKMKVELSYKY